MLLRKFLLIAMVASFISGCGGSGSSDSGDEIVDPIQPTVDPTQPTDNSVDDVSDIVVSSNIDDEAAFYAVGQDVTFTIEGNSIQTDSDQITLIHNEAVKEPTNSSSSSVSFDNILVEGFNEISLYLTDSDDRFSIVNRNVWAGSNTLNISIFDEQDQLTPSNIKLFLADDRNIATEGFADTGFLTIENIPSRTIIIEAKTEENKFGSTSITGGANSNVSVIVDGVGQPSNVDNNDFSSGLSGWEFEGEGTQTIVSE